MQHPPNVYLSSYLRYDSLFQMPSEGSH